MTKLDRYPPPAMTTFNEQIAVCTVFSKVDLKQAFQQVCVEESSQEKTALITTLGNLVSPHAVRVEKCCTMLSAECTPAAQRSAVRTLCLHGRCDSEQWQLGGPHSKSEMSLPEDEICRAPSKQEQVCTCSNGN